jgi:branched-chain amino acid transport system permease protein
LIEQILIYGAISGAVYALLAVGFTLIFGVAGIVNLAHGSFFMLGAYIFAVLVPISLSQLGLLPALILSTISVAVISIIFYKLTIRPVIDQEIAVMVVTVSVALIFQQLILQIFSAANLPVPSFFEGSVPILGVTVTYTRVSALVVSLVLFASLWIFITKSKIGAAMRAVSQDREAAMLMGINTERLYMLTMAISASLAALAGIFIAASTTGVASSWMWLQPLAMSFAIVILGGMGSIKGTLIGGFIVGYAEQAVAIAVPEGGAIVPVIPFAIMVLVLLLRPKGLFGKRIEIEE